MLFVFGSGSFALEIAEYARAAGHEVAGLIEARDANRVGSVVHGLRVHDSADLPAPGAKAVIGAQGDRIAMWERLAAHGWSAVTVVHPAAHVSGSAQLGKGCVVGPGAVIGAAATIGAHVLIGRGALVGHHVELGTGVVLNPGANVGGNSRVGSGARLGIGAVVVNGIAIGDDAVIAAGAVVVVPVDAGVRMQGVPARPFEDEE
jgi:sugar O-acyltransferase (sialic acid O-acetyltransferase NeuD family)